MALSVETSHGKSAPYFMFKGLYITFMVLPHFARLVVFGRVQMEI